MTVRKLKELLADIPDDERVYLDNGNGCFEGDEVVDATFISNARGTEHRVLIRTRHDLDIATWLDGVMVYFDEEGWDDVDAFNDLGEYGFTLDDFDYDPVVYEQVKEFTRTHAWEAK